MWTFFGTLTRIGFLISSPEVLEKPESWLLRERIGPGDPVPASWAPGARPACGATLFAMPSGGVERQEVESHDGRNLWYVI